MHNVTMSQNLVQCYAQCQCENVTLSQCHNVTLPLSQYLVQSWWLEPVVEVRARPGVFVTQSAAEGGWSGEGSIARPSHGLQHQTVLPSRAAAS